MVKRCNRCNRSKPLDAFAMQRNSPDGRRYSCKECYNKGTREQYRADPSSHMRRFVRRKYGITLEEYQAFLARPCAICGRPSECLDHDHSTGANRAGLCQPCNQMLGNGRDNPDTLIAGAAYLLEYQT
jgi:hypothetical protein